MSKFPLIALCALLAFPLTSVSASASSKSDPRPVTKSFAAGQFSWGKGGDFVFLWAPFNNNGQLEICGLYSTKGNSIGSRFSDQAMREAGIRLGKKYVIRGLKYFAFVPNEGRKNGHIGELAKCKVTKHPYPANANDLKIKFREGKYRIDK